MKKYIIPALVVVAFGTYLLFNRQQSTYVASTTGTSSSSTDGSAANTLSSGSTTTPAGSNPPVTTPITPPAKKGIYKDGTYQGSVADAYYGNLQVEAVIQGGKLVDCIPLQYPNDNGHTQEVSAMALPILKQEAIQSQNANVNIVSSATQTSQAFQQSLGVALAIAKN
jgi:uncharacterized protein with FMN-binding domain